MEPSMSRDKAFSHFLKLENESMIMLCRLSSSLIRCLQAWSRARAGSVQIIKCKLVSESCQHISNYAECFVTRHHMCGRGTTSTAVNLFAMLKFALQSSALLSSTNGLVFVVLPVLFRSACRSLPCQALISSALLCFPGL
jgi:hypothetical protein